MNSTLNNLHFQCLGSVLQIYLQFSNFKWYLLSIGNMMSPKEKHKRENSKMMNNNLCEKHIYIQYKLVYLTKLPALNVKLKTEVHCALFKWNIKSLLEVQANPLEYILKTQNSLNNSLPCKHWSGRDCTDHQSKSALQIFGKLTKPTFIRRLSFRAKQTVFILGCVL